MSALGQHALVLLATVAFLICNRSFARAKLSGLPLCTGTDLCPPGNATNYYYCNSGIAVDGCLPVTTDSTGFSATECSEQCLVANPGFKQCEVDPPCPRQLGTSWYHCQLGGAINGCMEARSDTKGFPSADCLLQCIFSNPPSPSPPELPTPEEPYINCTTHNLVNATITPRKCYNHTEQICKLSSGVLICKDNTTESCTPAVYGNVTYCACLKFPEGKLLNNTKGACPKSSPPVRPSPRPSSPRPTRVIVCQEKTARQQTGEDCKYKVVPGSCTKDAKTGVRICQEDTVQEVCTPVYKTAPVCECHYRDNGRIAKTTPGRCI